MFIISFLILVGIAQSVDPCTQTTQLTNVVKVIDRNGNNDTDNDYSYEMWTNTEGGDNKVSLYDQDAAFKAEWSNPNDFLGRVGLRWRDESGKVFSDYGNIIAEYAYTRSENNTGGPNYNYIGIYGWAYPDETKGIPLVEYYIIDDWFGNDYQKEDTPLTEWTLCPENEETRNACQKGSFTVDGEVYKIYSHIRVNEPSILGTTTFIQYFSIRQTTRKCGTITISEHFKKWNSLSLRMGKLYEASFLVEVESGTGFIDYTHAKVVVEAPDSDLTTPIGDYPPACVDRTPSVGSCGDLRDQVDAPPCYVQPDDETCNTLCPLDYENAAGKCVPIVYDATKCSARAVQTAGCKNASYEDADCDEFGCGPFCYLNVAKKGCSLACAAGEAAATASKYCERAPCPDRIPRGAALSSSSHSHSASNLAVNYDVYITVKRVEYVLGWKKDTSVSVSILGLSKQSAALTVNDGNKIFIINEVFDWRNVSPENLGNVAVSVSTPAYPLGSGTIDISGSIYKVAKVDDGSDTSFTYTDTSGGEYSNSFTIFFNVAVVCPSNYVFAGSECIPDTNWRCGSSSENVLCYLDGNTCTDTCTSPKAADAATGNCVEPDGSVLSHASHWVGWILCLLIAVVLL